LNEAQKCSARHFSAPDFLSLRPFRLTVVACLALRLPLILPIGSIKPRPSARRVRLISSFDCRPTGHPLQGMIGLLGPSFSAKLPEDACEKCIRFIFGLAQ
jgi:hypothetical protein